MAKGIQFKKKKSIFEIIFGKKERFRIIDVISGGRTFHFDNYKDAQKFVDKVGGVISFRHKRKRGLF